MTAKKDDVDMAKTNAPAHAPAQAPGQTPAKSSGGVAPAPKGAPLKVKLTKRAMNAPGPGPMPKGAGTTQFNIQDNGDETFTIMGETGSGNVVDISTVATISVTSDNPTAVTVDVPDPTKTTFGAHAAVSPPPKIGDTAKVTIVATWNDGSAGPFTLELTFTVQAGPVTGLVAVPTGTPTIH